jgi:hypothetical protein
MQSASLQNMQGIFYQIQMASIELAAFANKALRWAELQQVLPRIRPETRQSDRVLGPEGNNELLSNTL